MIPFGPIHDIVFLLPDMGSVDVRHFGWMVAAVGYAWFEIHTSQKHK